MSLYKTVNYNDIRKRGHFRIEEISSGTLEDIVNDILYSDALFLMNIVLSGFVGILAIFASTLSVKLFKLEIDGTTVEKLIKLARSIFNHNKIPIKEGNRPLENRQKLLYHDKKINAMQTETPE